MKNAACKTGISLSELCITMGLIGLLSLTMLSLNSFSNVKAMTIQTENSAAESALISWGKDVTNTLNGAIWNDINSTDTLIENLQGTLNAPDNRVIQVAKKYKNNTKAFTLSNGMVVLAQYRPNTLKSTRSGDYGLALIGVATDEQNITKPIAVYQLTKDGLVSVNSNQFDSFYAEKATKMLTQATIF